ncbi:MAG: peptidoglycan recognition family protein [Planctomycetota bacterium]
MALLTPPPQPWGRRRALLLTLALLGLSACTSPRRRPASMPVDTPVELPTTVQGRPAWVEQDLTWQKMLDIQDWLDRESRHSDPYWRIEARLQLAEGRMHFYAEEQGSLEASAARQRLGAARADFLRVKADPLATESQVRRAERGLQVPQGRAVTQTTTLPPGVIPRAQWGARAANRSNVTPAGSPWTVITVHHAASDESIAAMSSVGDARRAIQKIQRGHMDSNGWGDVGYHFLIDPAGRVYEGRSMQYQGAHAGKQGNHNNNEGNIGICLLGNFELERPSREALTALEQLVHNLQRAYNIPRNAVRAHLDWKSTECPGRFLLPYVRQLAR